MLSLANVLNELDEDQKQYCSKGKTMTVTAVELGDVTQRDKEE